MRKLLVLYLVLIMFALSFVPSYAIWDDFPSNLKAGYDLSNNVNNGNPFITLTSTYRGGEMQCAYWVQHWLFWNSYGATAWCESNTPSSKCVLTFFHDEGSYSANVYTKDWTGPNRFKHEHTETSVPFGIQYYFEFDNSGPGHDTHYLFYRIYDV